jgi:hypothetical protein
MALEGTVEDLLLGLGEAGVEDSESDPVGEATKTGSAEGIVRSFLWALGTSACTKAGEKPGSKTMS